ncbi:MAG: UDP-N-acetylmuramate--L-alanine ligase [bacterium]
MLEGMRHVHFVGIGGTGMSGIAKVMHELGYVVSGSDLNSTDVTRRLQDMGIRIFAGHQAENITGADTVVVSSAVQMANAEVQAANAAGIRLLHRAEMLAAIMTRQRGIAVAGSHGKTTTTSMISLLLEKNGLDPTVIIGGELNDIGGNAKLGKGEFLVAEADESDGSFLILAPQIVVVTNIENDHLDHYGSVEKIVEAFEQFITGIPADGTAILCLDDPNVRRIAGTLARTYFTYGLEVPADYSVRNIEWRPLGSSFDVFYRGKFLGRLELNVPGLHNIKNALAAVAAGRLAGLSVEAIRGALASFRGVHRRFQMTGEVGDVRVFDDYAHHPTEIKATLNAAGKVGAKRVIAVFQPHRYTRTKFLCDEFGAAFGAADLLVLTDIYSAGEAPIEGVDAGNIVDAVRAAGQNNLVFLPRLETIVPYLVETVRPGDLVLTLGAGNIWTVGEGLVAALRRATAAE